jgi:CHASE2 domain-containing sensor protein
MNFATFETLGIALALGLLVGLQRQRAEKPLAGIRTFPLITLFGTICAMLAQHFTPLMVPLGLLAIVVLVAIENLRRPAQAEKNSGVVTSGSARRACGRDSA